MADSCLQFVDGDQELVAGVEELASEKWNLNDWGVDYNIVAVCGQPDSGKTTLANALFGTQFPVLDENEEDVATEGIWISTASDTKMLVMDAEIATERWFERSWPDGLENCAIDDILDYEVVTLPSKIDAPNYFDAAVAELRGRFIDRHDPNYLFKPIYWKAVSASGITYYFRHLCYTLDEHWDVLDYKMSSYESAPDFYKNKNYLAEKRCCLFETQYKDHIDGFYDMTIHHTYSEFLEAIKPIQEEIDAKGITHEYLEQLLGHQRNAMATFNAAVEHHKDDTMYKAKRDVLRSQCNQKITFSTYEQTPWGSTGLVIQLLIDHTHQKEDAIRERVQQEVERCRKEMKLIDAQIKPKSEQYIGIHHLKTEVAKKDVEISKYMLRIDTLEAANGEKDKIIARLEAANSKKDKDNFHISYLKSVRFELDRHLPAQAPRLAPNLSRLMPRRTVVSSSTRNSDTPR
ncbi:hypothetical protein THASP1DRAFT_30762 [Thamnocephalis sphaerospora]|uniref:Root hair defective 3 GTP-binding protein-domain-containing protein n=1 Tax=Thamnocephalis sphaerospora TaxID=78915 RepID=A0A4P9XNA9_9FUNG|nr:hypothetical protein THASP1DRAFT_30762 [Thamnocephalis sphaerospora]|eukprot:RKP07424.1 hypothetical protein THASP1DRAFT_30762 [Thamnocephalis sphaerospora]